MTDINDLRVTCERIETKLSGLDETLKTLSVKLPENASARMEELEKDAKETLQWKAKMMGVGSVITILLTFKDILFSMFTRGTS